MKKFIEFFKKYWPIAKAYICLDIKEAALVYDILAQVGRDLAFNEQEAETYAEIMAKLKDKFNNEL